MLKIDPTPLLLRPPKFEIEAAKQLVASVLGSVHPDVNDLGLFNCEGDRYMIAGVLAFEVSNRGPTPAAAQWAIKELVDASMLKTSPRLTRQEWELLDQGKILNPTKLFFEIPIGWPTPFPNFLVSSTQQLIDWWQNASPPDLPMEDGPHAPDRFVWQGEMARGFSADQMEILTFAWEKRFAPPDRELVISKFGCGSFNDFQNIKSMISRIRTLMAPLDCTLGFKSKCLCFQPKKVTKK